MFDITQKLRKLLGLEVSKPREWIDPLLQDFDKTLRVDPNSLPAWDALAAFMNYLEEKLDEHEDPEQLNG